MIDLELKQLSGFIGTTRYYGVLGANVTDGIKYIMDNGYSWFVTDSLIVAKMKFKHEPFLSIKLKLKDKGAETIITDGNTKTLYKQQYLITDAKQNIDLFYCDNVLMLSNEY